VNHGYTDSRLQQHIFSRKLCNEETVFFICENEEQMERKGGAGEQIRRKVFADIMIYLKLRLLSPKNSFSLSLTSLYPAFAFPLRI
jgi:hypothetical protein